MTGNDAEAVERSSWPGQLVALPPALWSVRVGRHFVIHCLRRMKTHYDEDTAVLLASELLTNAIVHTKGSLDLTVTEVERGLRVEVRDEAPDALPIPVQPELEALDDAGRGLLLVAELASRWGTDLVTGDDGRPTAKAVWFELPPVHAATTEPPPTQRDAPVDNSSTMA
jgi:anti-sigma regulatory factor (Ser/Thr protein kinase)